MKVSKYLQRIGIDAHHTDFPPNLDNLKKLVRHHTFNVPFENLDVRSHKDIPLEILAAYNKIVERRRGGFCFELNPLFQWLLEQLGYSTSLLISRVAVQPGDPPPHTNIPDDPIPEEIGIPEQGWKFKTHVIILVDIGSEKWIADVGFGDGPTEPVKLAHGLEQTLSDGTKFKVEEDDYSDNKIKNGKCWIFYKWFRNKSQSTSSLQISQDGTWVKRIRFLQMSRVLSDCGPALQWVQRRNIHNKFYQTSFCVAFSPTEKKVLLANKYTKTNLQTGDHTIVHVESPEDFFRILKLEFNIEEDEYLKKNLLLDR